jgi:hypothetical protein
MTASRVRGGGGTAHKMKQFAPNTLAHNCSADSVAQHAVLCLTACCVVLCHAVLWFAHRDP